MNNIVFPWNLFQSLDESPKLKFCAAGRWTNGKISIFKLKQITFERSGIWLTDSWGDDYGIEDCKPFVVDPKKLTDKQWLYIFGVESNNSFYIERCEVGIILRDGFRSGAKDNSFSFGLERFDRCDQFILNRMYKKHSHTHYKTLKKKNIILDAGDVYGKV